MKIDIYVKGVLTVIAVCLIYLAIGAPSALPTTAAQEPLPQSPINPLPPQPLPQGAQVLSPTPTVVYGNDLGFRIERSVNGRPIGTLVVRINGRWVPTESSPRHVPLTH